MHFALTEDQEHLRAAVRELAAKFGDDYWAERDEKHEFPWDFYNAFADGGWLGIAIPEQYGGGGLGILEASLLLEEVAASGAGMNGCSTMHLTIFGLNTIVKHGSQELCQEILPRAADGSLHVCFGVTEPDAGTDTTRITTFAKRDGSDYVINGRKVWITKAGDSQKMVLIARTTPRVDAARPTDGMSLFLIDIESDQVHLNAIPKMGRNAVQSYEVFFDDHRVPESARIGEEGKGFKYLLDGLNPERILLAHEALGIGRAALRRAVTYAKERIVFDRPIGQNQGIAFPLAEAATRLDAAELMARNAAWRYDQGLSCGREANMAKYLCADAGFKAADQAIQTHGGMGYSKEFHVERYFRESRILRLAPVSQEMVLNYVSQHVLGLPKSY
ncbi:acyl-CoA dehydrogenase family protein [Mycolicibacterium confluentis]|uniref:Acyl-CoA dehydrogenase n=1 Tax=Mycolicibacterium confluentis TaxID=28047 RepID=A0A7I7Y267_9MYCO|nr:acyl-CoA dehydrogenase family protein [Mycolicibacterium confluentis]MCV7320617.1 acyl-CoA/acyl-ACP dehydrogenase [Mycolicibacterium confluentis]ORV30267.1 acyl-CoA dehydrogenase [Mycolicibacterium confluentis]BBZ35659.1 acyl-CoA dehydrogenase [Mycolicibacterium confluentis]